MDLLLTACLFKCYVEDCKQCLTSSLPLAHRSEMINPVVCLFICCLSVLVSFCSMCGSSGKIEPHHNLQIVRGECISFTKLFYFIFTFLFISAHNDLMVRRHLKFQHSRKSVLKSICLFWRSCLHSVAS